MLRTKKILSVLLVIMMLMQTLVITNFAADVDGFTDFPKNSWSTEAMTAAVDNGLLVGTSKTTIEPAKNLTRAEFAAIVTRAFGATKTADISNFKDVAADDWFYESVAKVVQMGVMNGTGATTFDPNAFMKREDVILAMARILFVDGTDISVLDQFSDRGNIDTWSLAAIAGMVAEDYVHGYEDGTIRPQNYITREELAQLFHNIFRTYISEDGEYDSVARTGSVIVRSKYVTLKDVTINGDLIMADGIGDGDFRISNVHVTGKIIARGGEGMNYFVDVTSGGKVIVNDPNGVVNFYNYRDEDTPFKNDNVIENTPATFLERQKPTGPSLGGGGTVSKTYTLSFYESVDAEDPMAEPIGAVKQKGSYVIKEEDVPTDESMEKDGFKFVGWTNGQETKTRDYFVGKSIKNVNGNWRPIYKVEYTITFVTPSGEVPVVKTEDQTIAANEIPEITVDESKEFLGWTKTEGSTNVDFTNDELTADVVENVFDTTDVTLYPVIVDKGSTTVIFKAPDGDVEITKYDNPDYVLTDADVPADPTPDEGFTFEGWAKDPAATEGEDRDYFVGKKISEVEGTWYPVFVELPDEYTITFVTPDGEVPVTKTEGETLNASEIPEITVDESQEFLGWTKTEGSTNVDFTNDELTADVVENVFDSTDVKLYPVIKDRNATTVIFKAPDGDVTITKYDDPDYVLTDADVPADPTPDEGFTFEGWAKDPAATEGEDRDYFVGKKISEVEGTWYPVFKEIEKPVTYTVEFKYTDKEEPINTVTKDLLSADDYVLTEADVYDVEYHTTPEDYTFLGWTETVDGTDYLTSEELRVSIKNLDGKTYYAQFEEIEKPVTYTVEFKYTDKDEPINTVTKDLLSADDYVLTETDVYDVEYHTNPADYEFLGWTTTVDGTDYLTSEELRVSIKTLNPEYFAQFKEIEEEPVTYTVEFKYTDGSKALETVTAELLEDDDFVLTEANVYDVEHNVAPSDYEFLGWTTTEDGTDYLTSAELRVSIKTLNSEYFAQFKKITNNYSVAFKYTDGSEALPTVTKTLMPSEDYSLLDTDVKDVEYFEDSEMYIFLGWTTTVDGTDYIASADIVGTSIKSVDGTTYYAQFEKLLVVNFIDYGYVAYTFYVRQGSTLADAFDPDGYVDDPLTEVGEYLDSFAFTGYEKNYDKEYIVSSNYTDATYYDDYKGEPNAHGHEVNYNWYLEDGTSYTPYEFDYVFTEDVDIYSKLKKLNVVFTFPEQLTGGEKVTLYVPYEEDTRFLDAVRDAMYINESSLMRQIELTGIEEKFYDRLSSVGGKFFDGDGLFNDKHEINNTDVMIYFYQMMGGKDSYRDWLWEEVEDAVEAALGERNGENSPRRQYERLRESGLNREQALYEFFVNNYYGLDFTRQDLAHALANYWDSAEFIEMSTEEEFFYVTANNDFIMEKVEEKISSLASLDAVIDEYVGDRIPAGLLNRLPMDIIEDIYEPRVQRFLDQLDAARAAAANGEPKENCMVDSGILFDVNLVEELLIPGMEFAETAHTKAVNKAVSSGNKAAQLVEKYYVDNPYTTGKAGNYGVVNYAFNPYLYVEDEDGNGFYSIKSIEEIYNNVVMPESVESIDALLWYMDKDGGAVDFGRIRNLAEENEALILALHNHPNKLMAEYAENGLPEDIITYYNDLLSDPEIKAAVEKLDNKVSFDMMYFVESKIQNATLEMYYMKVLERLGVPAETLLSKYTNSAAYKEFTHEDFVALLDDLEYCWATETVDGEDIENANGTTDFVIDRIFEKLGKAGEDKLEIPGADKDVKGFNVKIVRFFADGLTDTPA